MCVCVCVICGVYNVCAFSYMCIESRWWGVGGVYMYVALLSALASIMCVHWCVKWLHCSVNMAPIVSVPN